MAKKSGQRASKTKRPATSAPARSSSATGAARKAAPRARPVRAGTAREAAKTKKALKTGTAKPVAALAKVGGAAAKAPRVPPKRSAASAALGRRAAALVPSFALVPTAEPAEQPLTREEMQEFRQMLLRKRAEILGDVSTLQDEALNKNRRDAAGDLSSMPIHMADLGSDNFELEFTLGLIEGERAILKEIDEAMERIERGTYGLCLATGRPIGKARLKAKPWAKYCYEYTLAQEQGHTRKV